LLRLGSKWLVVKRGWIRAGKAKAFAGSLHKAVEVDTFAAQCAGKAFAFIAGELTGWEWDANPLLAEKLVVRQLAVSTHLGFILFELGVKLAGALLGAFKSNDAYAFVDVGCKFRVEIHEGGGHLAPVAEFERTFADARTSNDADGVGCAAVDLDEDDGALAIGIELTVRECPLPRGADAEAVHRKHRHAYTEDLTGAEMAVCDLRFAEEFIEFDGVTICGAHEFDATPVIASK
jgi:hypothetical protein